MWHPDPEDIFEEFCKYVDGKLNWAAMRDKEWTDTVFGFFGELTKKQSPSLSTNERLDEEGEGGRNYMTVDYVVRGYTLDGERRRYQHIILAVEHENTGDVPSFLKNEIRHLVDLKARTKIAITYPSYGDREDLFTGVQQLIQDSSFWGTLKSLDERYLVILGFTTTKDGGRAIEWQGRIFSMQGELVKQLRKVVFQTTKAT